ncbi:DUF1648 domain-containing protein [Lysinibacillus piscis]|uniref:Membrane protein n=1 Tax=Lysinibacillus piscis TaxID=2518931 RepID=A0ABQ5NPF2_9BACI|nr:DUF1648 domain-containing protein [Lysinibacillus sp. KH24]GLC90197.1 membrane protein [Lysinibacillus sp. KH24]
MVVTVLLSIYIVTVVIQMFIPYLVRETSVFGVTVPEQNLGHPLLKKMKKQYTQVIGIVSILLLIVMICSMVLLTLDDAVQALLFMSCLFGMLAVSMVIYGVNYRKVATLKKREQWGIHVKQVRAVDVTARSREEMLPWPFFAIPISMTVFMIFFTLWHYDQMPQQIATHWGPTGEADAWQEKNYFTAILLPLGMLIIQSIMWGTADSIKRSAIKVAVNHKEASVEEQLKTRKYISWNTAVVSYALTMLLTVLQLSNIYPSIATGKRLLPLFVLFLIIVLGSMTIYVWKKRQLRVRYDNRAPVSVMDIDDDRYWKGGLIYINRQDPSVFVEKRFGVGWTVNLGNPRVYVIYGIPLALLIVISLLAVFTYS